MLGEKKVELDGREWDLSLPEVALVEVPSWAPNHQDNHEELMEFIELQKLLKDAEIERVIEVGRLAILVRDVCKVLVDLDMPPIPEIPQDPCMDGDVLEMVSIILEHLREAYASGHEPWD
jgi:hypothetical protein